MIIDIPDPVEIFNKAAGAVEDGVEAVKDWFEDAGTWAFEAVGAVGEAAADAAETAAEAVDEGARQIADAAEDLGERLAATAEGIAGALATVVDELGDALADLVEIAEGVAEWFGSTVVDVVDWMVDEALPFLEGVIKTVVLVAWIFATLPVWLAAILICTALSREAGHEEGTLLRGVMDPGSRVAKQLRIRRLPAAGRYVIFSDLHRYDGGDLDIPKQNHVLPIYEQALRHYFAEQTWTVIENGDVEDYWLRGGSAWGVAYDAASGFIGPISDVAFEGSAGAVAALHLRKIVHSNRSVYALLRAFHNRRQYFRTIGNHDDVYRSERMVRELGQYFPGIGVDEYIVLDGARGAEAIIAHGHATDAWNTPICSFIGRTTTSLASALNELLPDQLEQGVPDEAATRRMLNRDADNVLTEVNRWVGVKTDFSSLDERSIHEGYRSEFGERGPMLVLGHTHAVRLSAWDPDLERPWTPYRNEGCGIFRDILTCLEWDGQRPPAERARLIAWLPDGTRREFAMRGRDKLELRPI